MNIYVGNLDYKLSEEEIRSAFENYGEVAEVNIITDKYSGRSKGFGFVIMENDEEAKAAIDALNESQLGTRNVVVNEARPRKSY